MEEEEKPITITIGIKTLVIVIVVVVAMLGGLTAWYWLQGEEMPPSVGAPAELKKVRDLAISYVSKHYPEVGQDLQGVKSWSGEEVKTEGGRKAYMFTGDGWKITIQWARHREIKAEITYIVSIEKLVGYDYLKWRGMVVRDMVREISHHFP